MSYFQFVPVEPDLTGTAHDGGGHAFAAGMSDGHWYDAYVLRMGKAMMEKIGPIDAHYTVIPHG